MGPWAFVLLILVSTLGLLLNGYVLLVLGLGKQVNSIMSRHLSHILQNLSRVRFVFFSFRRDSF